MKKGRKKNRYLAEYEADELKLELERGISLRIDLKDHLEVGVLLAKFRQAGLGSSRELGKLFRRSASTVINKERQRGMGSKRLIDGRKQKKRYKIEEIQTEILLVWVKKPVAEDKEIFEELQPRLSSLGMSLDLKSLKRYVKEAGIDEARGRLRTEQVLADRDPVSDKNVNGQDNTATGDRGNAEEKEITQTYSRYAGQMLHVPQLSLMGFSETVKVLPSPSEGCVYSKEKAAYMLYFLYAVGGKRLYDLDSLDHCGFGALIGEEDNLRSSGMNKRIAKIAQPEIIDLFQKKALAGRSGLVSRKDYELAYSDSHVTEVWVNKAITMAMHGTKNKRVKAINVHYLIGSDTGTPLAKEYTGGNRRLHWAVPRLVKRAEQGLNRRLKIICFDKGGISLNVLNGLIKTGNGFLCWGKRTEYVKKQIKKIKEYRFRYQRKKEIRQDGKLKKVVEKIADTTTYLKGLGKLRTIVVKLPEAEGGDKLWMYTNLKRNKYGPIELREMMRYKQRQENFFKARRYRSALDCFAGGKCRVKPISRPSRKVLELLKKQFRRLGKKIRKDEDSLCDIKELRSHGLYKADAAKREIEYLDRRIKQAVEQKEKTEEKIRWAEGSKRPKFIRQRYELELNKQKILNEFQDLMILSKRESLKEFLSCYKKVLGKEKYAPEEIEQRMKYLDKAAIEKELFNLGGVVTCDRRERKMTILIQPQGREYFRKALEIFLHQQNKKKVTVDYGNKQKYQLYFCLVPS